MPVTRDQATDTLRNIEQAERRSFVAYGYKSAAPFLILWGAIWIVGYSATDLWPTRAGEVWWALLAAGFIASGVIGRRQGSKTRTSSKSTIIGLRIVATWLVVLAFFYGAFTIMAPVTGEQTGAFIPLFFGMIYMVLGIWMGTRFAIAGAIIVALTMLGFFYIHPHFALWMAAVGGGTLILTGIWLRAA